MYHFLKDVYYKIIAIFKIETRNRKKTFWLLNTPDHGNIGDQAIVQSEKAFFRYYFLGYSIIELTARQWTLLEKFIVSHVGKQDIIFIHGGGYIGDLWPGAERMAREMLTCLESNKKIMLQNTIFYYDRDTESSLEFYHKNNIFLFLRDRNSYNIAQRYVNSDNCYLLPDTVLFLNYVNEKKIRNRELLVCLRSDKEQIQHGSILDELFEYADSKKMSIKTTDMMYKHDATIGIRKYIVKKKIREFQEAALVVTDRLHGMYFAAITGTPCIVLDNISGKVSGGYNEWLRECDFLYCVTGNRLDLCEVKKIMEKNIKVGSNIKLKKIFECEFRIIKDIVESGCK